LLYEALIYIFKCPDFIDRLPNIDHAGCWAQARRKFMDAKKGSGMVDIRQIYTVEKEGRQKKTLLSKCSRFGRKRPGRSWLISVGKKNEGRHPGDHKEEQEKSQPCLDDNRADE